MKIDKLEAASFEAALVHAFDNHDLTCYAIIDHAQDASLLKKFSKE